jgi:hypothetical protein
VHEDWGEAVLGSGEGMRRAAWGESERVTTTHADNRSKRRKDIGVNQPSLKLHLRFVCLIWRFEQFGTKPRTRLWMAWQEDLHRSALHTEGQTSTTKMINKV